MCQFVAYVLRPLNLAPIFYVFLFRRLCYAFIAIRTYVLHYLKFGAHDLLPKTTPKQYTCCTLRPLNLAPMFYDPLFRRLCSSSRQFGAYVPPIGVGERGLEGAEISLSPPDSGTILFFLYMLLLQNIRARPKNGLQHPRFGHDFSSCYAYGF